MAALMKLKTFITPLISRNPAAFNNIIRRHKVTTKHDYKPGPYPETEEQRRAAAERYGLSYEEYEPYPKDYPCDFGDYPKLPLIGAALKSNFYPWDYPDEKRNYNESPHVYWKMLGEDACDFGEVPRVSYRMQTFVIFLTLAFFIGIHYALKPYPCFRPVLEKQMPKPGKVYYTFEPAD